MGATSGGIALAVREGGRVLSVERSPNFVAAALQLPRVGLAIVAGIYIPPVNSVHFTTYSRTLDNLAEAVGVLQLRHGIARERVLIGGDFNAHVGREDCGRPRCIPELGWGAVAQGTYQVRRFSRCTGSVGHANA